MIKTFTLSNVWYGTQLATLLFSFFTFTSSYRLFYILSYISIIASLVISLYQSLISDQKKQSTSSTSSLNEGAASKSNTDPNISYTNSKNQIIDFLNSLKPLIKPAQSHSTTPYILLTIAYVLILPRYILTLIPFTIFAFFHALNYTRTFIVPLLPINLNSQTMIKSTLENLNEKYNNKAFKLAVWVQIFIFTTIVIWTIVNLPLNLIGYGDGHILLDLLTVIIWFYFINIIQSQNLLMKSALSDIVTIIDGIVVDPRIPFQIKDAWIRIKYLVKYKNLDHAE
jgi:hypothetical protein